MGITADVGVLERKSCKRCKKTLCFAGNGTIEIVSAGSKYTIPTTKTAKIKCGICSTDNLIDPNAIPIVRTISAK